MITLSDKLKQINTEIWREFGTNSYDIRCKIYDITTFCDHIDKTMEDQIMYTLSLFYREEIDQDEATKIILDMAKIQLPVRIEDTILEKLKELAKVENRSLSNYVDTILKEHLNGFKKAESVKEKNI